LELDKAFASIMAMQEAPSLDDFEEAWKCYLFRLERCFNKAQAYFKKSPKWDAWWGKYKQLRASDDLLAYLINARGAEEHSVEEIVGRGGPEVAIKPVSGNSLHIKRLTITGDGDVCLQSPQKLKVRFYPERVTLLPIRNRGRYYPAPVTHLGSNIDSEDVCGVARLAHQFYSEFLRSAEEYFVK
jgi:hypothetical protein